MSVVALIPTDLESTSLGLPSLLGKSVSGGAVLAHTISRVACSKLVDSIAIVHPASQNPRELFDESDVPKPVHFVATDGPKDVGWAARASARKWSLSAWRGGLGGMTCYDELLPAAPLLTAMEQLSASSALLVGADWMLVDPELCDRLLELHLQHPETLKMTFCQAPPGIAGIAVARIFMEQLAENDATMGGVLGYNPKKPQADPIGRDPCLQISASVRSCARRFIYDTPRSAGLIDRLATDFGDQLVHADSLAVTTAASSDELLAGPQQITLELTPHRDVNGPITPQHHASFDRAPMSRADAIRIVEQIGSDGDVALTLGGLGDALLNEHWCDVVEASHAAGVMGIGIETDLLVDQDQLNRLLELPVDVVSVRINADTAETYEKVMGIDAHKRVIDNVQWLLNERTKRSGSLWIVPRMIKTADTLADMERFFDRWMYFLGHAVIEPPPDGCGIFPESLLTQPNRLPCRQISGVRGAGGRMTIHSEGRVPYCDEDWLAVGSAGNAFEKPLSEIWQAMLADADFEDKQPTLCSGCEQWYRVPALI